ncbi:calmodulin-1 [Eurytemora carolleeae]|uniref:calmodulin-1 n=1 Tax=Eurytemora carolleeae TaxID=1294199 RepID=UPI000C7690EF|nr:calmodulin-1 [Eurytemora carolleeae]|eukprot:XP_023327987.1 calmodulin-1-like [Eurytemora affinis]
MGDQMEPEEFKSYQAAFDAFDWGHNGKIKYSSLQAAMRRAGQNPTDVEVLDIINKIDDDSGCLDFQEFCYIMTEQNKQADQETGYKETFRVFSKDEEGCIPAEEIK